MPDTITADEMRALEQEAIASGRVTGLELMERAGQGVVEAIFEEWPDLDNADPKYATVICGPGNNGGDGFVIARHLRDMGWYVDIVALGRPENHSTDAKAMLDRLSPPANFVPWADAWRCGGAIFETPTALVVDAVFGLGLSRPLDDNLQGLLCSDLELYVANDFGTKCVAVDIPSGIDADNGNVVGGDTANAFKAHLTVTFHATKPGHVLNPGAQHCGKTVVKDIGL